MWGSFTGGLISPLRRSSAVYLISVRFVLLGLFRRYLGCVSEHMNELMPFGDVPQKLSLPLKRSFVAARTYAQSLNSVGDIVANLVNVIIFRPRIPIFSLTHMLTDRPG